MSWDFWARTVEFVIDAHQNHPREPAMAFRRWDGRTPYEFHPIWCATSIVTEENLAEVFRQLGAQVLLLHDILEDTTCELPADTPDRVRELVADMTFESTAAEKVEVWGKSNFVILLKLFDKANNCLNIAGMRPESRRAYAEYTMKLCEHVERVWGQLNITYLTRAICARHLQ